MQPPPPNVVPNVILQGRVRRVTYENESSGYRVIRLDLDDGSVATVVGTFAQVLPEADVHVVGKKVDDPKFGTQIQAESVTVIAPTTVVGLERFLASGVVKGVGERLAKRIVDHFGDSTLQVLDDGGARFADVRGIRPATAAAIGEAWARQRVANDVIVFLRGHGLPPKLALRVLKRYGARAIDAVRGNPYLLAAEVRGVGFLTADRIAASLGVAPDAPERLEAGVVHVLDRVAEAGHTFVDRASLVRAAASELGVRPRVVDDAISGAASSGRLVVEAGPGGEPRAYPATLYRAEARLVEALGEILSAPATPLTDPVEAVGKFETEAKIILGDAQRRAVDAAARYKVLIITGGPGVGKTTLVRALLALFARSRLVVGLAAPTGRAAKRLAESTRHDASTLHRLLEVDARTGGFLRTRTRKLDLDALVVDEASMLDVELAHSLVDALPTRARLLLVGDVDQLPSVGPGAVLRDLLASGAVPSVRLTTIFRQAATSLIVDGAHRILAGQLPTTSRDPRGDFFVVEREDPVAACATVRDLVCRRIPDAFDLDPRRDIQVLTPMHKGAVGVVALNEALQSALNPGGAGVTRGERTLRVGDKVMQLRNDYERDVYNGDVGFVVALEPGDKKLVVSLDEREVVYAEEQLDDLALAYAISIHKSQGSEYPAVVIPWLRQHAVMLSKNLLYTAVTRGKRLVVLVADPHALSIALADDRREERQTSLAERLRAASLAVDGIWGGGYAV